MDKVAQAKLSAYAEWAENGRFSPPPYGGAKIEEGDAGAAGRMEAQLKRAERGRSTAIGRLTVRGIVPRWMFEGEESISATGRWSVLKLGNRPVAIMYRGEGEYVIECTDEVCVMVGHTMFIVAPGIDREIDVTGQGGDV